MSEAEIHNTGTDSVDEPYVRIPYRKLVAWQSAIEIISGYDVTDGDELLDRIADEMLCIRPEKSGSCCKRR